MIAHMDISDAGTRGNLCIESLANGKIRLSPTSQSFELNTAQVLMLMKLLSAAMSASR